MQTLDRLEDLAGLVQQFLAGDLVSRRRLAPIVLAVAAAGLVVSAEAPSIGIMIGVAWFVGLGSVVAQFLVPMAASLADDAHRGEVVGTVMTGLLTGILLARTLSGLVAGMGAYSYTLAGAYLGTTAQMSSAEENLVSTGGEARNEARLVWPSPARQAR